MDKTESIAKDMEHYFGFLNGKGFRIRSIEYAAQFFGNWVVEFESPVCNIFITSDRNYLLLEFSSKNDWSGDKRLTIERALSDLSKGNINIEPFKGNLFWGKKKQLERLSSLLSNYIDDILVCFNNGGGQFSAPEHSNIQ